MAKINFSITPKEGATEQFFKRAKWNFILPLFMKYGDLGVMALAEATPKDTGETANSWRYQIKHDKYKWELIFLNDEIVGHNTVLAIILQYGHLSRSGSFVEGRDYINPAIQPIFDNIQSDFEKELNAL
jgi:hypothetical protein